MEDIPDDMFFYVIYDMNDFDSIYTYTHIFHVWYIYQHLPKKHPNVGKYTIHGAYGIYICGSHSTQALMSGNGRRAST